MNIKLLLHVENLSHLNLTFYATQFMFIVLYLDYYYGDCFQLPIVKFLF